MFQISFPLLHFFLPLYADMLLAIDIGNSSTKFGLFDGKVLIGKFTIQTKRDETENSVYAQIHHQITHNISAIVISSVVKELKETYTILGKKYFNIKPFVVDHQFDFGFSINYFPPEQCGADRLIDAFAAVEQYGIPCLVCDFGTATTIDVVDANKRYLGGIITPGINTLASALFDKTSKLPEVELIKPAKIIGNSTVSSIQSGIYFGYIGLVDGIIKRMLAELNQPAQVVSTGGFAEFIAEESEYIEIIDKHLMLEGLRLINEKINGD
jgi:type III pantothenate kinase